MRRSVYILVIALAAATAGCVLRGKSTASKPPAAPLTKPTAPAARSAPPPEPLSIPQTQVQLPPPQPLNQAALANTDAPPAAEPVERPASRPPARRVPSSSRPEPPAAQPVPQAVQPPEPERPIVQEKISPEEQKRITDTIAGHRREIDRMLKQAAARGADRAALDRIRSFLKLSDEAAGRADLRQAEAHSERALILARELQSAR